MRTAVLTLLAFATCAYSEPELRAGVARVEITPAGNMPMYGYANRKCGPANGVHDPLFAKALVLEAGGSRLALVTTDLGSLVSGNLPRRVASELSIPVLLLAASHTHSAPSFLPYGSSPASGSGANEYLADLEQKIFDAVREASTAMFPARLHGGRGSLQLGYNRLLLRENGRARALFDNLERVPYGPVDPEFVLLRIDDAEGAPRALLVHYAAHAVVLGPTNCKYSADYPGVMQTWAEREIKGAQVMFVQGGAGDINPLFMARSGNEDEDFKVMQKMGELLGAEVLRVNSTLKPLAPAPASIQFKSEALTFKDRWEEHKDVDVGITTVLINRQIAIAATPGELMHRLQKTWKEQADVPYPLFYGYTSSSASAWPGYIPDLRSAAYGGYGADVSTRIEIGAGERIMLRHITNLYELLGMWHGKPGRP
jgi:hypothetical protein